MRRQNDFYETSAFAVTELLKSIPIGGLLLEPCSGLGAIAKPLREFYPSAKVITNDIDATLPADWHLDASKVATWDRWHEYSVIPDWVITNPPFNQAFKILVHSYNNTNKGIALLLRLSFLEPTYERQDWLNEHPPNELIVLPRFSFTGDGKTDSVTCAWMVWDKINRWNRNHITIIKK